MDPDTMQLLEGFAHELRTPLSAIAGHSALLSLGVHGPVSEAQAHALARIEENKKAMVSLINGLVSYAEAASAIRAYPLEKRALRPIISQGVAALSEPARAQAVRLVWPDPDSKSESERESHANESWPDLALFHESTTLEIVTAMLEDAFARSDREHVIQVRLQRLEQFLRVEVESTAPARTDRDAERLFVPYARDSHGRPVYAPGLSLSLPRARALARCMGGDLRAVFAESRRVLQFDLPRHADIRLTANA